MDRFETVLSGRIVQKENNRSSSQYSRYNGVL